MNTKELKKAASNFESSSKKIIRHLMAIGYSESEKDVIKEEDEIDYLKTEIKNMRSILNKIDAIIK